MNLSINALGRAPAFYAVIVVLATVMALGSMQLVAIGAPFDHGTPADMIVGWLAFIVLSPLLWLAGGTKLSNLGWKERLPRAAFASIAVATLAEAAGALAARFISNAPLLREDYALLMMDDGLRIKFIASFAIIQIVQGLRLRIERLEQEQRAASLEAQLAATRLSTLRMQLHPHFLFNTLNSVTALLRRNPKAAREMLRQLSVLFERSLDLEGGDRVPLREEIALLQNYLEIEKTRFGDRLQVVIDVEDNVAACLVPSLILQPLVENSIRHGLAPRAVGGIVLVRGFRQQDSVIILVSDDGRGLPAGGFCEGIGLRNTRMRLEYLYGKRQTLAVEPNPEGGVTVRLILPFEIQLPVESAA